MAFRFAGLFLLLSCISTIVVAEDDFNSMAENENEEIDPRFLIILPSTSSSILNVNTTAALLSLLGAAALLTALGFLIYYVVSWKVSSLKGYGGYGGGYGGSYGSGSYGSSYGSSYGGSSGYRRSGDIDWESLNILDYISMMEEMWRKFDVKDMACQKRVLCEIHQNESAFGPAASRVVKMFSYMRYLSLLSLPEAVKEMIQDYQEAVDRGGDKDADCGQLYDSCEFSFKDTFTKYIGPKENSLK